MIYILYFDREEYTNSLHLPKFTELLTKRLKCISCIFKSNILECRGSRAGSWKP